MISYIANEEIAITVPLVRDGEPFLADAGTVVWTLRDTEGGLLETQPAVPDPIDTFVQITIPATLNGLAVGRRFEKRALIVTGKADGQPFSTRVNYRLTPWLNHTVTNTDVRAFIGTDIGELPNEEIDLDEAYFAISDRLGAAFEPALSSGTRSEQVVNNAIKAQAVLDCLPGMRARMSKREEDGIMKVERFQIDWDALAAAALQLLKDADVLVGGLDDTAVAPTLFVLTNPTPELFPGG